MKNFNVIKLAISQSRSTWRTAKNLSLLLVSGSLLFTSCRKDAADGSIAPDSKNNKEGAAVSAVGRPIITVFPVRAAHNTGWDSATGGSNPSSFNCGSTHSNEDWQNSSDPHYGIDIFAAMGAPLVAPTSGVIVAKGSSGYGNRVAIRDANGWHHWLIHMNSIASGLPAVGGSITAGTPIGTVGMTGGAGDVPHLHYHVTPGPETSGYWSTGIDFYPELRPTEVNVCGPISPTCSSVGTFDDFATSVGRFNRAPTYSGTTVGVATTSTATRYVSGSSTHLQVTLNDNTAVTTNWFVRLLSGDGIAANNVCTVKTGNLYFWLKTSNAGTGATVRIWVDDSDGTEQSAAISVINDGAWHKYNWPLSTTTWTAAAGGNGALTAASVTLDAIILQRPNSSAQWVSFIDDVGN